MQWSLLGIGTFALLLSLLYARSVHEEVQALSNAPTLKSIPDKIMRDDWMSERLAASALEEVGALLRDKRMREAKDAMQRLLRRFPRTDAASETRRILTQIHLDQFLAKSAGDEIKSYRVKKGDSPLAIAKKFKTTYISLEALNGRAALDSLKPGDSLLYRSLEDHLVILPDQGRLELRRAQNLLASFEIIASHLPEGLSEGSSKVSEIIAYSGRSRKRSIDPGFSAGRKVIGLKGRNQVIAGSAPGEAGRDFEGIFLTPSTMNELILLIRPGNEVVISSGT